MPLLVVQLNQTWLLFLAAKPRARAAPPAGEPILFDDTSASTPAINSQGYYAPGYSMGGPPNNMQGGPGMGNLFADPMANAAMMYGSSLANQGKDMVNKEVRERAILPHPRRRVWVCGNNPGIRSEPVIQSHLGSFECMLREHFVSYLWSTLLILFCSPRSLYGQSTLILGCANMFVSVWCICLHKSVNRIAKTGWASFFLLVQTEMQSRPVFFRSLWLSMLTLPTPSVLICKGVRVCSYFTFQISRFMSVNKLKYFFAVDTRYVMKKLIILLFPYTHQVSTFIPRHTLSRKRTRNISECGDKPSCRHITWYLESLVVHTRSHTVPFRLWFSCGFKHSVLW